jgi:outer membrane receptor protein involved in Fe transport
MSLIKRYIVLNLLLGVTLSGLCAMRVSAQEQGVTALRVSGVVVDESGAAVADALVSLRVGGVTESQTTKADGLFAFAPKDASEYLLTIRARGFSTFMREVKLKDTEFLDLRVVLKPALLFEQVTVTATRTEKSVGETPASIAVLSSSDLESTAALTLDDTLRQIPGFQLFRRAGSRAANPTTQGVSLRGVGASGASRALVLNDGVPINDPFGGWVYWGRVPRAAVGQVEVLRGGASALYGSSALGGVINLITRRADAPLLSLEASYGNESTPDVSLFAAGGKDDWRATLGAEIFRTGGYKLVDERESGAVDVNAGTRDAALDFKLERRLTETASVFMRAAYFGEARENGTPLQTNRTHLREFSAGGDWQNARVGTFSLRLYGGTQVFDQNFSAVSTDRNTETLTRVQRVPSQSAGLSVQFSRVVGKIHTLVAGLEWQEVRGASDEIIYAQARPSSLVGAGGRERSAGIFMEDIVRVTPRLYLTGGVRLDHWRNERAQSATRSLRQAGTGTVNLFADRGETAFSPQASVLYKLRDSISLNASAYRAFRAPTLNELYRTFRVGDVQTLANENLRAERLTGGEAGASITAFETKLNVRASLFWSDITRPIANVTLSSTPILINRRRENLGRTRSRGLELEADARLAKRWTLSGGYLFADARVRRFPANIALEGLLIPQVARHQATAQVRYINPQRLTLGVQARASGAQFDDDQNRFRLAPYFTLDAFVSRPVSSHLEIFASAENLFNNRYEVGRTPVKTLGPPLLWRVGFRLKLGPQ